LKLQKVTGTSGLTSNTLITLPVAANAPERPQLSRPFFLANSDAFGRLQRRIIQNASRACIENPSILKDSQRLFRSASRGSRGTRGRPSGEIEKLCMNCGPGVLSS
jgi:hypothetical protein